MKKLIASIITILITISISVSIIKFGEYSNFENNSEAKYAAIPPVKLPPVPPTD